MLVKTLLNKTCKYKSFVYGKVKQEKNRITVKVYARSNSRPICSGCLSPSPGYDKLEERAFEHVPIWGIPFFFLYRVRRVNCPSCGVKVEKLPWADGKNTLTKPYMHFLAKWGKHLPWTKVAEIFKTTSDKVFRSVEYVVEWGLRHRKLDGIKAIGVDEVQWKRGHKYLTLVYEIRKDNPRLLWMEKDRTEESFSRFFEMLGDDACKGIEYACSDMWSAYLKVIKEKVPDAIHVLDRFHIVANLNKALDSVRAEEHRKMKADGYVPLLEKSRWVLLKRPENLSENQEMKLNDLLQYNLKSVRAYLLKAEFQSFWSYITPGWAGKFLDRWTTRVMRSRIEPMKKEARSIRKHKDLILNWFRAKKQFSSGIVEGLNNKVKVTVRKSYGFREFNTIRIALFHSLGRLPEPPETHSFC